MKKIEEDIIINEKGHLEAPDGIEKLSGREVFEIMEKEFNQFHEVIDEKISSIECAIEEEKDKEQQQKLEKSLKMTNKLMLVNGTIFSLIYINIEEAISNKEN